MSDAAGGSSRQLSLFAGDAAAADAPPPAAVVPPAAPPAATPPDADLAARAFATDPANNVVLEASAGTGKTSVLVLRYVNLLKAGVDPANILAITFTRKAAAEMRERIIRELKAAAARSEFDKARWRELRERLGEIAISTIDAFCLSLLREFPLEADLDPGFDMADETEVPRLIEESLDQSLRIFAGLAREDPDVALVLAQLGVIADARRAGLAARAPAGGLGRARPVPRQGAARPHRRRSSAGAPRPRSRMRCAPCRAAWRDFWRTARSATPRYQMLRARPRAAAGYRTRRRGRRSAR